MVCISPPTDIHVDLNERPTKRRRATKWALPTAAELYVERLPGLDPSSQLTMFAGNLPATTSNAQSDAQLYFLLARQRHIPKRQRLILWLNGGPGCSSFDGALMEIGPVRVNRDGTLREVPGAWNEYASVLFLDQPAGTGFSYVNKNGAVRELRQAAQQVVNFLISFYAIFPEFATQDTFIAGESYAGQYIPYIADAIRNSDALSTTLSGLLIGNGWISPREQYPAYLTYLTDRGLVKEGSSQYRSIKASLDTCTEEIASIEAKNPDGQGLVLVAKCEEMLGTIDAATKKDDLCLNQYNTTQYQTCGAEWPTDLKQVTRYLRRSDVVKALHAEEGARQHSWTQCSQEVASRFWAFRSVPSVSLLPSLLKDMPILLYNGDQDLMCAGQGIEAMIDKLSWNGGTGFNASVVQPWSVDGKSVGTWQTARNLTYVNFHEASHMVPIDAPLAAHDMLLRFMQVDTLHAAGPAARVPSRIGSETEAVLGATHPNGTSIKEIEEAARLEAEAGAGGGGEKDVTEDGFDKEHEARYGPRRTAVLFLSICGIAFALWALLRWRGGRRRDRYRRLKGKGKAIQLEEGLPRTLSKSRRKEERGSRTSPGTDLSTPVQVQDQQRDQKRAEEIFDIGTAESESDADDPDRFGDLGQVKRNQNPWA